MLLFKKSNAVSNLAATRTAALGLTYYDRANHPQTTDNPSWASPTVYRGTVASTATSGAIKTSIDEIVTAFEDKFSLTVSEKMAYCQYYKQSDTEPGIHYDTQTGFDPVYKPTHVAVLWLTETENAIQFYRQTGDDTYDPPVESVLTENDLVFFNHENAHRIKPASFGTDETDSGLMLAVFIKAS